MKRGDEQEGRKKQAASQGPRSTVEPIAKTANVRGRGGGLGE